MKLYNADRELIGSIDGLYVSIKWNDRHHFAEEFETIEEFEEYKERHGLMYEWELSQLSLDL